MAVSSIRVGEGLEEGLFELNASSSAISVRQPPWDACGNRIYFWLPGVDVFSAP